MSSTIALNNWRRRKLTKLLVLLSSVDTSFSSSMSNSSTTVLYDYNSDIWRYFYPSSDSSPYAIDVFWYYYCSVLGIKLAFSLVFVAVPNSLLVVTWLHTTSPVHSITYSSFHPPPPPTPFLGHEHKCSQVVHSSVNIFSTDAKRTSSAAGQPPTNVIWSQLWSSQEGRVLCLQCTCQVCLDTVYRSYMLSKGFFLMERKPRSTSLRLRKLLGLRSLQACLNGHF